MNSYTHGMQEALMKLGAVPFTGQEADYFQQLLKARGMGTSLPKTQMAPVAPQTMVAQPAMAYAPTEGLPRTQLSAQGVERGTMPGGAPAARAQGMEALRARLDPVPGGGRQLALPPGGRQLAVAPQHTIERFLAPMEQPGTNLARQMGKAEGAKALGLGGATGVMEEGLLKRLLRMGQKVRV